MVLDSPQIHNHDTNPSSNSDFCHYARDYDWSVRASLTVGGDALFGETNRSVLAHYYEFSPPSSGNYTLSTCGSKFDTTLAVFITDGSGVFDAHSTAQVGYFNDEGSEVCSYDSCGDSDSLETVTIPFYAGLTYIIEMQGYYDPSYPSTRMGAGEYRLGVYQTEECPASDTFQQFPDAYHWKEFNETAPHTAVVINTSFYFTGHRSSDEDALWVDGLKAFSLRASSQASYDSTCGEYGCSSYYSTCGEYDVKALFGENAASSDGFDLTVSYGSFDPSLCVVRCKN